MLLKFINQLATAMKGREFRVDPEVSTRYLSRYLSLRALMLIRGRLRFPFGPTVLIGRNVRMLEKRLIKFGASVVIGDGVYIDALSREGVILGDYSSVGRGTRVECTGTLERIGRGVRVGRGSSLGTDCFYGAAGGIEIADDTIVGNFVSFHSENHVAADRDMPIARQGVTHVGIVVGSGCWIGAKATVLDGAVIGDGVIIAAGAVVTAGKYESNCIYGGIPARELSVR